MVERKPLEVREELQSLKDNGVLENYTYEPKHVRRFFVSNIFQRVLAHILGWSEDGARRLICTTAGILKVATTGAGFEHNDTKTGNAPDAYGAAIVFDSVCSRVDIFISTNSAIIKRSADGSTYDDEIEITSGTFYSFDCVTHSINIKNKTAGQVAVYKIIGWY